MSIWVKFFKRILNIITQAVLNATASTFSKSLALGTWNGILFTAKTGTLNDADTVTVTLRDSKGAKPIVNGLTIATLRKMSNLFFACPNDDSEFYLPIGCVTLGNGVELDITYNRAAAGNAATIYLSAVLLQEEYEHILQRIAVTGDDIVNKDIDSLFITNAGTYPDATIEIGFVNGRSWMCTLQELISASNVFGNGIVEVTDVVCAYQNQGILNEIEYVRVSDANITMVYVSNIVDPDTVTKPIQQAVVFQAVKEQKNTIARPDKYRAAQKAVNAQFAVKSQPKALD